MQRRQFLRSTALAITALGAIPLLSSCSDDDATGASRTLRVGALGNPADTLDPGTASTTATYVALYGIYDALALVVDGQLQLRIAESITPNDNATVWTVTLRETQFSDGSPVTAGDVLASYQHYAQSPMLGSHFMDFDFAASRAIDDKTIELVLTRPRA
ncbi:MAG: ABC transporter substrate-binding protein, partial [Rhodococcus sp.]|nr:ABC transporter substrate-binding protein [Rhodococcus sp. (in: high G+C Gram-positive bacteria)]